MDRAEKRKVFAFISDRFETDSIREYFFDMVEEIPDYIFTMPSSTSGKYHNETQCKRFGQLYHEFMFASILEHRLRLKGNKEKFGTPEIRDCMRCVPFFHDAIKCGLNGSKFTVQNHPMLAAEWVRETNVIHNIDNEYKEIIAGMCEAHSGEWNKSRSGKEIMPEPRNEMEFFIHECDILASRNDIDMIIPEELTETLNDLKTIEPEVVLDINEYILTFGKHSGEKLIDVAQTDKGYIAWAKENMTREPMKTLLAQL